MDEIHVGESVFCGSSHVGHVAKLIADASDSRITDLVVDRGLLHGAKVVPLGQVKDVRDGEVQLALDVDQFQQTNGFADQNFRYPGHDWRTPSGYESMDFLLQAYVSEGSAAGYGPGALPEDPSDLTLDPPDPRPNLLRPILKEGTPVRAVDGEQVGEVRSLSFHAEDGRLTTIEMKWGLLDHEHRELPLEWVREVDDKGVTLSVTAAEARRPGHTG